MLAQDRLPGLVAERLGEARRTDDVGEHERLRGTSQARCGGRPGPGARARRPRRRPARRAGGTTRAPLELEVGAIVVVDAAQRVGTGARGPGPPRTAQPTSRQPLIAARSSWIAPGASPSARRTRARATWRPASKRRRRIVPDDLLETIDRRAGPGDVAGRDGDLDLCREQPGPRPAVPGLLGDGGVDRARRRLDVALGEADEGERRLRRSAAGVRLPQGLLGRPRSRPSAGGCRRWRRTRRPAAASRCRRRARSSHARAPARPAPTHRRQRRPRRGGSGRRRGNPRATAGCSTSRSPRSTRWPGGSRSCRGRRRSSGRRSPRS